MQINVLDYFAEEDVYVLTDQIKGITLSELRKQNSLIPMEDVKGFRIGRYGKYLLLPLYFDINSDWFYVSELLRTDGHISKDLIQIKLTSITTILKEKVMSLFISHGITYIRNKEYDRIQIFNRTLALVLNKIFDIPAGNKTFICEMPEWMKNADLKLVSYAIKGAFDGDGCVQLTKGRHGGGSTRRIRLYGASTKYLDDLQYCLLRFGINSKIFKDPRENKTYFLQISRRDDILLFARHINFLHPKRKKLLSKIVAYYKNYYFLGDFEKLVIEILKETGELTIGQLAKEVKRKDSTVSEQITKLEKEGKIKTKMAGVRRFVYIP